MELFSQRDPAYSHLPMTPSKLPIGGYGCFLCAIGTLYQIHPLTLLKVQGGMRQDGNLVSSILAKSAGGTARQETSSPINGWQIAVTNHYAPQFPTHFFCVNPEKNEMIDPLDYPTKVRPLTYKILKYRPFSNILLNTESWQEEAESWARKHKIIVTGWDNPEAPMSQVRVAAAIKNFYESFSR